jgi:hypothetical protein
MIDKMRIFSLFYFLAPSSAFWVLLLFFRLREGFLSNLAVMIDKMILFQVVAFDGLGQPLGL